VETNNNNVTASIVIYKNDKEEINNLLLTLINSIVSFLYVVDNSPTDESKERVS
jgi:hypothetical protein